jgi:hypothetical protein
VVLVPSTMPLRVGDELVASARVTAEATGRSAAQQLGYWAKLGRELERSGSVSVREIAEVLAGARAYDDLDPRAQAVVRAEWSERIADRLDALDLAAEFAAENRSWVELAPDGTTIRHDGAPRAKARKATGARRAKAGAPVAKKPAAKKATAKKTPARKTATKQQQQQVATAARAARKAPVRAR